MAVGLGGVVDQPVHQQQLHAKREVERVELARLDFGAQAGEVVGEGAVLAHVLVAEGIVMLAHQGLFGLEVGLARSRRETPGPALPRPDRRRGWPPPVAPCG